MEASVIPFERASVPAVKDEYVAAIRMWCVDRSLSNALSREEIGAMQKFDRVDAQRKALILGFADYLRDHPRSDVALGVFLITTLMSDNDDGRSTVSQPTMARLFNRSVSSIADAQRRLKEKNMIVMGRGRYAGSYPVIPRVVTQTYNHLAWLISAINEEPPLNLPAPPVDCQSSGPTGGLVQSLGTTGGLKPVNHPVEAASIIRPDAIQLHLLNSKEERGPREGSIARVATAVAATFVAAVPLAAAAHPVEQFQTVAAECWQTQKAQMGAAMNANEARAQKQVWVTPNGLVEVAGDFRVELERTFPLVDLTCGLATAGTNVRADSGALNAMQQIRRQFGYMQQDEARKQARAVSYGKKPKTMAQLTEKPESMPQIVWDKIQRDIAEKNAKC